MLYKYSVSGTIPLVFEVFTNTCLPKKVGVFPNGCKDFSKIRTYKKSFKLFLIAFEDSSSNVFNCLLHTTC